MSLITLLLYPHFLLLIHPFYVSITEVNYNEASQRMEIGCRIFYDDLEAALISDGSGKTDLIKPTDRTAVDSTLSRYLKRHFKIIVNGKPVSVSYLGYQIEEDVAWCFLESARVTGIKKIQFKNDMLFHHFKNQTNIMHVKIGNVKKSAKLDNPDSIVNIDI